MNGEVSFDRMPYLLCEVMAKLENIEKMLNNPGEIKKVEIIDCRELCKRLNITEPTVIRWRAKGLIPFLNIGSAVRFNYLEVIEALETKNKKGAKRA